MDPLTVHVQVLSLVHQSHHLLGFSGHSLEPAQSFGLSFGLLGGSMGQEMIQVLGEVVSL